MYRTEFQKGVEYVTIPLSEYERYLALNNALFMLDNLEYVDIQKPQGFRDAVTIYGFDDAVGDYFEVTTRTFSEAVQEAYSCHLHEVQTKKDDVKVISVLFNKILFAICIVLSVCLYFA